MHVHQAASFSWKEDPWSDLLYMVCRVWSASQIYWMTLEVHLNKYYQPISVWESINVCSVSEKEQNEKLSHLLELMMDLKVQKRISFSPG
jgi:hypothetical protein